MPSRQFSFDLNGCRDWLDKLYRECDRLEAVEDRTEASDHATNAALTGWHLHEWVWAEVKEIERANPPTGDHLDADTENQLRLQLEDQKRKLAVLRAEIGEKLGCKPSKVGKVEFGVFMAKSCRPIELCRVIATGSKHLDVDDAGEIVAYVSAPPQHPPSSEDEESPFFFSGVLKIQTPERVSASVGVFREAAAAWNEFIYSYKIDRFN